MRLRLTTPEIAILVSGAMWGLYWIPLRYLEGYGVDAVWTLRGLFVVSLVVLVPILIRHAPTRAGFTPRMLATGLLTGGAFVLYSISIVLTEVVTAILLFYLSPVWATVLGRFLLAERFTGGRVAALVLGLGGLWVVLGVESGVPLPRNAGDWCALAAGVAWAFGTLRVHQDTAISSVAHVTSMFVGGAVIIAIGSMLPIAADPLPVMTVHAGSVIVFLAALSVVSAWGILWGARVVSPGRAGILLMTEVVTALASAAVLSGEPFGLAQFVGSVLIVAAGLVEVLPRAVPDRA